MPQIDVSVSELDDTTRTFPLVGQVRQTVEGETIVVMPKAEWEFEIVSFNHALGDGSLDARVDVGGGQVRFVGDNANGVPVSGPPFSLTEFVPDQTGPLLVMPGQLVSITTVNTSTGGDDSYVFQFTCRRTKG